jgi:DNA-binding transcriptional LysR family regulator
MELRHLRYFVAVAEELNFTRAAKRLSISQPPLSLQIRQLEKEMGVPLLRRQRRGVELTNVGMLMLEEARVILKQIDQTKTDVRRRARGEAGSINIGAGGGTYFHPLIPSIIREYRMRYPDVILAPETSNSPLLVARLRARLIDVAFIWPPISDRKDLMLEPLFDEEIVIIVPLGHALSGASSAPLAALAEEPFILPPREVNPGVFDSIIAACHRAGFNPKLGPEVPQVVSTVPIVAAGLGVSIIPRCISRIKIDGVVYVPIEGDAPQAGVSLAYRSDDRSSTVQNFVAVARRARGIANLRESEDAAIKNRRTATLTSRGRPNVS